MAKLGVIGAGSWGTALAVLLHSNGHTVHLWSRNSEVIKNLVDERVNRKYLPKVEIPEGIKIEADLNKAVRAKDGLLVGVPSHAVRSVINQFDEIDEETIIISLAKGIENGTLLRVSQILNEKFNEDKIAVLSGPSHAEEVSRGVPTLVVCASSNSDTGKWV